MPAAVTIELDTLPPAAPSFSLPESTVLADIIASVGTEDPDTTGYEMKIWGQVNPASDPAIQVTEFDSDWASFQTERIIHVLTGQGPRTVYLKLRDDVWNETNAMSDIIAMLASGYEGLDPRTFTYAGAGPAAYAGLGPASYPDQDSGTYEEAIDESPRESEYGN